MIIIMSQFQLFTITTKLSETESHIRNLEKAKQKITANSEQVQVDSVERLNRVALMRVTMMHTSEYLIKMGKEYYAKVKANTAIQIINTRIQYYVEQTTKLEKIRDQIKKKIMEGTDMVKREQIGSSSMEPIGINEEGEEIFNIVQFSQPDTKITQPSLIHNLEKKAQLKTIVETVEEDESLKPQKNQRNRQEQNTDTDKSKHKRTEEHQQKLEAPTPTTNEQQCYQEKPKKISKFKAERMQNKNK